MKYAVFSNYGNWDSDCIGFIGFVEADPSTAFAAAINTLHSKHVEEPVVADDIEVIDDSEFEQVIEAYEVSFYVEPDFNSFAIYKLEHHMDMLIGLIEVP